MSLRLVRTSWTVVLESYLKDLVWPFSRKTFSTLGMNGEVESGVESEGCGPMGGRRYSALANQRLVFKKKKIDLNLLTKFRSVFFYGPMGRQHFRTVANGRAAFQNVSQWEGGV